MSMDLNLLPTRAKFQAAKMKLKRQIRFVMWGLGIVWFILVLAVFGVYVLSQVNLKNAEKKLKLSQDQYKALAGDAVLSYQIKYQAKLVGKVLSDRFEYGSSIQKINSIFSSNVILSNYEIKNFKQFVLEGKLLNGKNMDEVEDLTRSINNGEVEDLKSAKLNSVNINTDGSWGFNMEVNLK